MQLNYNRDTLDQVDCLDIQFTIDGQLFLEKLMTEIRGKIISVASYKKKETNKLENALVNEIQKLEENIQTTVTLENLNQTNLNYKF